VVSVRGYAGDLDPRGLDFGEIWSGRRIASLIIFMAIYFALTELTASYIFDWLKL